MMIYFIEVFLMSKLFMDQFYVSFCVMIAFHKLFLTEFSFLQFEGLAQERMCS